MDPFHPHLQTHQYSPHQQPPLQTTLPHHFPPRSGNGTPVQSPGLFSPSNQWANMNFSNQSSSDTSTAAGLNSPYLHPLQTQNHTVRETHIAQVDRDTMTGRKVINQYEVIEEIGRGVHGKVKLAKNQLNGENVAIKIIPRFSKKRRLGKITTRDPVDKTKREIAILKKIRHPNVVALLEVIDDPELKKIYMILEHVELGEIVWRKKGLPNICQFERRRIEREIRGEKLSEEEEQYAMLLERRQTIKDMKRARIARGQASHADFWSFEYGASVDDDSDLLASENEAVPKSARPRSASAEGARSTSKPSSRVHSGGSISRGATPQPIETIDEQMAAHHSSAQSPLPLNTAAGSPTALEGTMYGAYVDDPLIRARSPSMADSIISHMSSLDFNPQEHDPFADDFSYVPCFTLDQIRNIFRDTVLGLEYLHYQGVVHRDIKPANLLFTRDHRVKISDFGVSYFGRPIRDGEPDDLVSESEAYDFDNEVELAKTVGTPAFFAPELCYTDLDGPMPKVSEQIDVWSLGVTLYCLVFARIPFMAEDEFQMFRKIATEDAYIPRRRLRPVDPCISPNQISLHKRVNVPPYRDDNELAYEEIDELLHDLLRRTLIKNPDKRIRLMDVKRHPWVAEGIPNLHQWLEETDPRRKESGKKISVDEREMSSAVIPLTLLERAKSVVKKAVDKVIHGRSDGGRRRAASSVASSTGDSTNNMPTTPHPRDLRRKSLKPDDYFAALREHTHQSEHPLTQSVTASPLEASGDQWKSVGAASPRRPGFDVASDYNSTSDATEKSAPASITTASSKPYQRHSYAKSITNAILSLTPNFDSAQASPAGNDVPSDDPLSAIRRTRDLRAVSDDSSRARSVDRGLFSSQDKRAEPKVSLSTATAPGNVKFRRPRPMRSIDLGKASVVPALPSPVFSSPRALSAYQHPHPQSDPNIHVRQEDHVEARPATAHRIEDIPEGRVFHTSTPESFSRTKEQLNFEQATDSEAEAIQSSKLRSRRDLHPTLINCFNSSDDEMPGDRFRQPTDENTTGTVKSSSSNSIGDMATPLTSPTAMTSPMCAPSKENSESMLVFQSDPSLPTLLSGASSISADFEGDFLAHPGVVNRTSFIETADSLTPPAIAKEASTGFPIDQDFEASSFAVRIGTRPLRKSTISPKLPPRRIAEDDNDSGSESEEEFLMMGKSKKKASVKEHMQATRIYAARRRDTNISIASTETAKKVGVDVE